MKYISIDASLHVRSNVYDSLIIIGIISSPEHLIGPL